MFTCDKLQFLLIFPSYSFFTDAFHLLFLVISRSIFAWSMNILFCSSILVVLMSFSVLLILTLATSKSLF